jgi:hypothetical protein
MAFIKEPPKNLVYLSLHPTAAETGLPGVRSNTRLAMGQNDSLENRLFGCLSFPKNAKVYLK